MAAAPVNPPSNDEVSALSGILLWLRDWGWSVIGSIGLPSAWYVSGRITKIEERLEQHAEKFEEQVRTNKEIKDTVSTLADKEDIREVRQDLRDMRRDVSAALASQIGFKTARSD